MQKCPVQLRHHCPVAPIYAANEQKVAMEQISDAINSLDNQTQVNANIANQTNEIASQTLVLANNIVTVVNNKEFRGK